MGGENRASASTLLPLLFPNTIPPSLPHPRDPGAAAEGAQPGAAGGVPRQAALPKPVPGCSQGRRGSGALPGSNAPLQKHPVAQTCPGSCLQPAACPPRGFGGRGGTKPGWARCLQALPLPAASGSVFPAELVVQIHLCRCSSAGQPSGTQTASFPCALLGSSPSASSFSCFQEQFEKCTAVIEPCAAWAKRLALPRKAGPCRRRCLCRGAGNPRSHAGAGFRPAGPCGCGLGDTAPVRHLPLCYLGYFAAFWSLSQGAAAGCMGKLGEFSKSEQALMAGRAGGTWGARWQLPACGRAGNFPISLKSQQGIRTLCPQRAGDVQRRFGFGGVSTSGLRCPAGTAG